MLQDTLQVSMGKLLDLLQEWRYRSELEIIPEHLLTSTTITKVEDLTSRIRHLVTMMEVVE